MRFYVLDLYVLRYGGINPVFYGDASYDQKCHYYCYWDSHNVNKCVESSKPPAII